MEEKKTVIWHGGLDALLASAPAEDKKEPERRRASFAERAKEPQLTRVEVLDPELPLHVQDITDEPDARVSEVPPPRARIAQRNHESGTRIMGSWSGVTVPTHGKESGLSSAMQPEPVPAPAPPPEPAPEPREESQEGGGLPVTRVLAIEEVVQREAARAPNLEKPVPAAPPAVAAPIAPALARKLPAAARAPSSSDTQPVGMPAKLKHLRARVGRERLMLYGGLTVFVLLGLTVRVVREMSVDESSSANAVSSAPQLAPQPVDLAPTPAETPSAPVPSATTTGVAPEGLERAATDALARGDYALAQQIYAELAKRVPAPSPFSEAARILARSQPDGPGR